MSDPAAPHSTSTLDPQVAALLKRDHQGLVAAIIQQHDTGEVLMLGWMDDEALARTLTSGRVTFWSRSRNEYWRKGDSYRAYKANVPRWLPRLQPYQEL